MNKKLEKLYENPLKQKKSLKFVFLIYIRYHFILMKLKFLFFCTFFLYLSSQHAHAYLDPGSGSLLVQAIIAAIAGISTTVALYWKKLKNFLKKIITAKNKKK